MSRGQRIRRYRKLRGLTQKGLAEKIGLGESAVRNYELDLRDPSDEVLTALAQALEIPITALDDYEVESSREVLEALFRLEDAVGLKPTGDGKLAIDHKAKKAPKLDAALKAWRSALDDLESGDMTQDEYDLWRASLS